jgi:carbon monoxide dehydrogenase subunit G
VYETDYALTLRAAAPLDTVWDELGALERVLENIPTISSFEVDVDGQHASFTGALTRWPASWRSLPGQVEITSSEAPRRLELTMTVPDVGLHFVGTFELDPVAAEETNVSYRGELRCDDPLVARLRHVLTGILESHIHALATRIASRAARRTAAAHALGHA